MKIDYIPIAIMKRPTSTQHSAAEYCGSSYVTVGSYPRLFKKCTHSCGEIQGSPQECVHYVPYVHYEDMTSTNHHRGLTIWWTVH